MSIADTQSRNGWSPRPGTVHRPTRASLPPVQGPGREPVTPLPTVYVGDVMGASGLTHREDWRRMGPDEKRAALVKLNTARPGFVTPEDFAALTATTD